MLCRDHKVEVGVVLYSWIISKFDKLAGFEGLVPQAARMTKAQVKSLRMKFLR